MKYFERLGLVREPFSSSPDPGFLFYSRQHITCLQELEIAVRLRRGLNMVIGDIGTGKTTLCRRFVRNLSRNKSISVHLLLDPGFSSARAFLRVLCTQLCGELPDSRLSLWSLKEMIKKALLRMGMREDKTIVLIIDEGQKMSRECLELRNQRRQAAPDRDFRPAGAGTRGRGHAQLPRPREFLSQAQPAELP
jgi:type II secretory pathway predicted ATPase ExeA